MVSHSVCRRFAATGWQSRPCLPAGLPEACREIPEPFRVVIIRIAGALRGGPDEIDEGQHLLGRPAHDKPAVAVVGEFRKNSPPWQCIDTPTPGRKSSGSMNCRKVGIHGSYRGQ